MPDNGEDDTMDFGLPFGRPGAGDADPVLEKGLPRFCGELEAMLVCSVGECQHELGRPKAKQIKRPSSFGYGGRSGSWRCIMIGREAIEVSESRFCRHIGNSKCGG